MLIVYVYTHTHTHVCVCVCVTQSCLSLCDSMDCSPPGFSVHGILQARILEWVAFFFYYEVIILPTMLYHSYF